MIIDTEKMRLLVVHHFNLETQKAADLQEMNQTISQIAQNSFQECKTEYLQRIDAFEKLVREALPFIKESVIQ